jgi:hypothetical protein
MNHILFLRYPFIFLFLIIIFSCHTTEEPVKVILPCNIEYLHKAGVGNDTLVSILQSDDYKIITIIDGDCPKCHAQLELWNQYIREVRKKKIPVSFYVVITATSKLVFEYTTEKYQYNFSYFLDLNNEFLRNNSWLSLEKDKTFLTNEENQIIYSGNPVLNSKVKLKYIEIFEISRILSKH